MADESSDGDGQTDVKFLLDVLFDHNMVWVQNLLKEKDLPAGGQKPVLRNRVKKYLDDEKLETEDLVHLLDDIEGWGNQHIYLFKASDTLIADLADEKKVKDRLRELHKIRLFNRRLPLILPDQPTLSAIEWSADRVSFVWVEKRLYRDPRDDKSYTEGALEYDAYEVKRSRGIISFSCDLVNGQAELLIQRLPSGNNYLAEQKKYLDELAGFFDIKQLAAVKISGAIRKADQVKSIRKRSSQLATISGCQATLTSRSRKDDVYKDASMRAARKALGKGVAGRLGNFYWPILGRDIHIKLYAKDQRIGLFGECTEEEVRHVLSEVRRYC